MITCITYFALAIVSERSVCALGKYSTPCQVKSVLSRIISVIKPTPVMKITATEIVEGQVPLPPPPRKSVSEGVRGYLPQVKATCIKNRGGKHLSRRRRPIRSLPPRQAHGPARLISFSSCRPCAQSPPGSLSGRLLRFSCPWGRRVSVAAADPSCRAGRASCPWPPQPRLHPGGAAC